MTDLTPSMTKALNHANTYGFLFRQPGGLWTYRGVKNWNGVPEWCVNTKTIEDLVSRGTLQYTRWQNDRTGKMPVRVEPVAPAVATPAPEPPAPPPIAEKPREPAKPRYSLSEHNKRRGKKNREAVRTYFAKHLCATHKECAAALGMNACVVGRHVKAIRAEWMGKEPTT